jgi:adenosylmethionine-8-amino-7-oxononanoate aminotransferase
LFANGGADRIAAFFCEPVIGTGGVIQPVPGYLENVQRLCRKHGVLLVIDEVICGFGRTGTTFASHRFDIEPDLLLFAKGVTSGYQPLGGALISGRVAEPFWAEESELILRHGLTYQAHAAACVAALENLRILEEEGLVDRVLGLEGVLAEALAPLAAEPEVVEIRAGFGLLAGIVLRDAATAAAAVSRCWERGVLTRQIADGEVLQVSPSFVIGEEELGWAAEQISAALADLREAPAAVTGGR